MKRSAVSVVKRTVARAYRPKTVAPPQSAAAAIAKRPALTWKSSHAARGSSGSGMTMQ